MLIQVEISLPLKTLSTIHHQHNLNLEDLVKIQEIYSEVIIKLQVCLEEWVRQQASLQEWVLKHQVYSEEWARLLEADRVCLEEWVSHKE